MPTAVEVKLLLSEYSTCGFSAVVGLPPPLGDDLPVPHEHEAVHRVDLLVGRLDELADLGGRDPLRFGRAAGQRCLFTRTGEAPTMPTMRNAISPRRSMCHLVCKVAERETIRRVPGRLKHDSY